MLESIFETIRYLFTVVWFLALLRAWVQIHKEDVLILKEEKWAWFASIIGGPVLAFIYAHYKVRTQVEGALMLVTSAFLLFFLFPYLLLSKKKSGFLKDKWEHIYLVGLFLLILPRASAWSSFLLRRSSNVFEVLSTDLLITFSGFLTGVIILALAYFVIKNLACYAKAGHLFYLLLLIIIPSIIEYLSWGYYSFAVAGWVSIPDWLFTPVAAIINNIHAFAYFQMGLAVIFGVWMFFKRHKPDISLGEINPAKKRKYYWNIRREWRLGVSLLVILFIINGTSLYYKLYANQPPKRTPSKTVEADKGNIKIPLSSLQENELYRFGYANETGIEIRFLVLKTSTGRIGVAYDACLLCRDYGYIKKDQQLVCLACGAAIYGPTMGRPGGCNPIPLDHRLETNNLIINVKTLLQGRGAGFFHSSHKS